MRKLLYNPTDSKDFTLNPTIAPQLAKTAEFNTINNKNKCWKHTNFWVNKIPIIITEPEVNGPRKIPARTFPIRTWKDKGLIGSNNISAKFFGKKTFPTNRKHRSRKTNSHRR
jgi:hypothetical protein